MTSASVPPPGPTRLELAGQPDAVASLPPELLAPPRLLAGGGTDFERRLLSTSGPTLPSASRERLARALQVADGGGPNPVLDQPLTVQAAGRWSKLASVAVLGGMVVLGGVARHWPGAAEVASAPSNAVPVAPAQQSDGNLEPLGVPPRAATAPRAANVPEPVASARAAVASAPRGVAAASGQRSSQARRGTRSLRPAADAQPLAGGGLRAELRALEAAQSALAAGRASEAARQLDDHAVRFPRGELTLEAELLRVDVLLAQGARERAAEQARALLGRRGAERYRERLEGLVRRSTVQGDGATADGSMPRGTHMKGRR